MLPAAAGFAFFVASFKVFYYYTHINMASMYLPTYLPTYYLVIKWKKKVKFFKNFYTHTNMASMYLPTTYIVIK